MAGSNDHEVGGPALADDAAVAQPEPLGRHGRELRDGRLERQDAALAHVAAEHAGGRPVRPGMRHATPEDGVARAARLGVGADGDPGHGHDRLDVGLVHAVQDAVDRQALVGEDVQRELRGIAALRTGDLGERPAVPPGAGRGVGHDDAVPARVVPPRSPSRRCRAPAARGCVAGRRDRAGRRRRRRGRARGRPGAGPWPGSCGPPCTGTGRRRHRGPRRGRARSGRRARGRCRTPPGRRP